MKGKGIAGCDRWELRRGHGGKYHNWAALVKGKLVKSVVRNLVQQTEPRQTEGHCLLAHDELFRE